MLEKSGLLRVSALVQIGLLLSLTISFAGLVNAGTGLPVPGIVSDAFAGRAFATKAVASVPYQVGSSLPVGAQLAGGSVVQSTGSATITLSNGATIQAIEGVPTTIPAGTTGTLSSIQEGAVTVEHASAPAVAGGASATGALLQGFVWGAVLYLGVKMIGSMVGLSKPATDALAKAAFIGGVSGGLVKAGLYYFNQGSTATTQFGSGYFSGTAGQWGFASGLAITLIVFILMYKDTKTKVVSYQCLPWEAPLGGAKCDECAKNPLVPCSEYRCRALGQACELVNPGTTEEKCVWVSKFDVKSPVITPSVAALSPAGLAYAPLESRPTARGTRIVHNAGCLDAYTPLEFGFTTDEPAQCKIDFKDGNYSALQFFVGESNYFITNHTQKMKLPGPDAQAGPTLKNDGTMSWYVKCQDKNGNVNEDVYVIEYCVSKGPDTTPPVIMSTSILSGSAVRYNIGSVPIEVYTNEPASCKWSRTSKAFTDMENTFACASSPVQLNGDLSYTCSGNVTGLEDRKDNQYYFRCQDLHNNTMTQSYSYLLKGSQPLTILETAPNGTLKGSTPAVKVTLGVKTDDGADTGKATCYYAGASTLDVPIEFDNTDSYTHSQELALGAGTYQFNYTCIDTGGNSVSRAVNFTVFVDNQAPIVTRVYREEALKIVTNEPAQCSYSLQNCNFNLDDGVKLEYKNSAVLNELFVDWKSSLTYYIKCADSYGNQPTPEYCSVVVSPKDTLQSK